MERPSPLGDQPGRPDRLITVTAELRALTLEVGRVFGLDIHGVDVLLTPRGWVAVDVNDFPSFGQILDAAGVVAESVLRIARRAIAAGGRALRGQAVVRRRARTA